MANLILYSYWRSSCSYRVRIGLYLKDLVFEYRPVHLVRGGQHQAAYRALNPMAQVPCLVHGDRSLGESMAILDYLDGLREEPPLFPKDPWTGARVRQLCEMINAGIQPIQNLSVLKELKKRFGAGPEAVTAWVVDWINRGFQALERKIAETAGTFAVGDRVTAVELFLVPQVYNANRYGVEMTRFPFLQRIDEACRNLPAFQKADPSCQPDARAPA